MTSKAPHCPVMLLLMLVFLASSGARSLPSVVADTQRDDSDNDNDNANNDNANNNARGPLDDSVVISREMLALAELLTAAGGGGEEEEGGKGDWWLSRVLGSTPQQISGAAAGTGGYAGEHEEEEGGVLSSLSSSSSSSFPSSSFPSSSSSSSSSPKRSWARSSRFLVPSGMKRKMFWTPLGHLPASARLGRPQNLKPTSEDSGSPVFRYG